MDDTEIKNGPESAPVKRKSLTKIFRTASGDVVKYKGLKKFFRDIIAYHNGFVVQGKHEVTTVPDVNCPLGSGVLTPGPGSPICAACGLDKMGATKPYLPYLGSENPLVTIIVESISKKDDARGKMGASGQIAYLAGLIHRRLDKHGITLGDIRWVPLTRCAFISGKFPNYKTKGNWCRYHVIQDLTAH